VLDFCRIFFSLSCQILPPCSRLQPIPFMFIPEDYCSWDEVYNFVDRYQFPQNTSIFHQLHCHLMSYTFMIFQVIHMMACKVMSRGHHHHHHHHGYNQNYAPLVTSHKHINLMELAYVIPVPKTTV